MKNYLTMGLLFIVLVLSGCKRSVDSKGFAVSETVPREETKADGISRDTPGFPARPGNVLLTGNPRYRLTPVYKVNFKRDSTTFTGTNSYYYRYDEFGEIENRWNGNFLPGLEAVYGYNMVNVSHFDFESQKQKNFFDKPVLVRTLYYPSFSKDTLNNAPVTRDYFMISVYDEDTNKDGFINLKDLRRFYSFDATAGNRRSIVPENYSVFRCEYDPANDFIFVSARLDENRNGTADGLEPVHIFWVDLKDPGRTGRQY